MKTYLHPYDGSEIIHMDEQDMIDEEWAQIEADAEQHVRANLDTEMIGEAIASMEEGEHEDLFRFYVAHERMEIGILVSAAIDRYIKTCAELRVKEGQR